MHTITWLDPRTDDADEPAWAVWETECGQYRITYDASTDRYEPHRVVKTKRDATTHTQQIPLAAGQDTLEAAQAVINDYHCQQYGLTLA